MAAIMLMLIKFNIHSLAVFVWIVLQPLNFSPQVSTKVALE